jgi:hypothetical protein
MRRRGLTFGQRLSLVAAAIALAVPTSIALATPLQAQTGHVTGLIVSGDANSLIVQTPGKAVGVLNALTSAADRLWAGDYPYVWGGGHAEAGIASVGEVGGSGFNGKRRGYDCSGAVAAVLAAGGLWPAGGSVPNDAGVISHLLRAGLIAPGAGTGAHEVTLYDQPGVHIFMSINGRFFGTSDGGRGGDARGGPGWLDAGPDVTSSRFKRYHVVPRVLDARTDAGYTLGFELSTRVELGTGVQAGAGVQLGTEAGVQLGTGAGVQLGTGAGVQLGTGAEAGPGVGSGVLPYPVGTDVAVTYRTTPSGMLVAESVTPIGELSAAGTVQSVGPDGSTLTIVSTTTGAPATFDVMPGSYLAQQLAAGQVVAGDTVSAGYLGTPPAAQTLVALTVTSTPAAATTPTPTPTIPPTTTVTATTPTTTQTAPTPLS